MGLPNFVPMLQRFNLSYWSLVVEVHFYIALPLLFFATRGMKTRPAAVILFLALALIPLAMRLLTWPADPAVAADARVTGFLMARFPCELDYFAWGVLFGGLYASGAASGKMRRAAALGYAGTALFAVTLCLFSFWSWHYAIHARPLQWSVEFFHWAPGVSVFLMLFFILDPASAGARLLGHPWLRFTGLVSYEWFLFHGPVVHEFAEVFGKTHGSLFQYFMKTVFPLALTFLRGRLPLVFPAAHEPHPRERPQRPARVPYPMKPAAGDRVHDWEIKPSSGGHLDVLDGIRGVAILMVVVFHTFYTNPTNCRSARQEPWAI